MTWSTVLVIGWVGIEDKKRERGSKCTPKGMGTDVVPCLADAMGLLRLHSNALLTAAWHAVCMPYTLHDPGRRCLFVAAAEIMAGHNWHVIVSANSSVLLNRLQT